MPALFPATHFAVIASPRLLPDRAPKSEKLRPEPQLKSNNKTGCRAGFTRLSV
jgi:hypothetical protein